MIRCFVVFFTVLQIDLLLIFVFLITDDPQASATDVINKINEGNALI